MIVIDYVHSLNASVVAKWHQHLVHKVYFCDTVEFLRYGNTILPGRTNVVRTFKMTLLHELRGRKIRKGYVTWS